MATAQSLFYRISTALTSFKTLYTLPRDTVDAFLASYVIYEHNWNNERGMIERFGTNYCTEVSKRLVDYYRVLNHLCAIGQVEKMYIPPAMNLSEGIIDNQERFEKKMGEDLDIGRESKVLDIGCGRGRVANHLARHTGADVTGINIDPDQLASAVRFAEIKGISERCRFQRADINEHPLPFADGSMDAIYDIQCCFSLARDLGRMFKEIHRILKPGGRFAALEWATLDNYDPTNPHHAALMRRIKPLIGAIGTRSLKECTELLSRAGFKIVINENASIDGLQAPLIEHADRFFTRVKSVIECLVRWKILPDHVKALFDRLTQDGQALVEADRLRLVTTSHYVLARKMAPLDPATHDATARLTSS